MELLCKKYTKRDDVREKAYSDIAEILEKLDKAVKVKINGLPAQLGREINKENKTKSGQGSHEQYHSSWPFWSQLTFLKRVVTATKSKDNFIYYFPHYLKLIFPSLQLKPININ